MRRLSRYWGYLLAAIVAAAWASQWLGPAALMLASGATALYALFGAPVWCGALTRGRQMCRNNAYGVLMGCHLRQHRWQKLKLAVVPAAWRELNRDLWTDPRTGLATLVGLSSIASTVVAGLTLATTQA